MTNFPNGVASYGMPVLPKAAADVRTGRTYWVSNNTTVPSAQVAVGQDISHPGGGTFNKPFATIAYAITQCRANAGDTIIVKEGHAETMTPTLINVSIAGVRIIGLGSGTNRPTLTYDTATDIFTISAANVEVHNLRVLATAANVVAAFAVTAVDAQINDVLVSETGTSNFVHFVTASGAANTADRLAVRRVRWVSDDAGVVGLVTAAASVDSLLLEDCTLLFSAGVTAGLLLTLATDAQATGLVAKGHVLQNALVDTAGIVVAGTAATSSGVIMESYIQSLDAQAAAFMAAATTPIALGNNWYTGAAAEPRMINTVGATVYSDA